MIRQLALQVKCTHNHMAGNISCTGQAETETAQAAVSCLMYCMLSQLAVRFKHAAALSNMPDPSYPYRGAF